MTVGKDVSQPSDDADLMMRNVMLATGLSKEAVESLLLTDDDLDMLCDTVLADLAMPSTRVTKADA